MLREVHPLSCYQTLIYGFLALSFNIPQALNGPICKLEIILVNDSSFNNVSACILWTNSDNFKEASSGLFETGNNVTDINNLVNPSARLTSTSDAYDNLVDASTCLNSTSTKVNVKLVT